MGPKTFEKIVNHIYPIRKSLVYPDGVFDYPEYGGLPKRISNNLSPEAVDAMQDVLFDLEGNLSFYKRKYQFRSAYKERLRDLGEPGKY